MKIGTREVGPNAPVFIIAECGIAHLGNLDAALALIDGAAEAGADAAKFQRFRVDSFLIAREHAESLRPYELPDEWLPKLRERCDLQGIEFLCTAFDYASLDVIDPFVNAHKVGSWEAGNHPGIGDDYLLAVRRKGKAIIASNGAGYPERIGHDEMIVLQCTSRYPADVRGYLAHRPAAPWGVSDHTVGDVVAACAIALGACVVEKHIGFGHPLEPDRFVSMTLPRFANFVGMARDCESAVRG